MGTIDTTKPNLASMLHERKAFDETKAGVKGLVDAGINKIPSFFHHQPDKYHKSNNTNHVVPVIDLADIIDNNQDSSIHQDIVHRIKEACETWGFFQLITNDRFKSVEHRVVANHVGPRISVACFSCHRSSSKLYGPMKEL
ncbi:hypothetical protein RYX36_024816 [Vicia faba]